MLTKTLLVAIAICATLNLSSALRCNVCLGALGGDCDAGKKSAMADFDCGIEADFLGYKPSTDEDYDVMCVSVTVNEQPLMSENAQHGCGVMPKGQDLCKYLEENGMASSCSTCTSDNCN